MQIDSTENIPSVLACDCGNGAIKIATIKGDEVSGIQSFQLGDLGTLCSALEALWETLAEPKRIVACSVNAVALKALEAAACEATDQPVLVVGRDIQPPMPMDLLEPEKLGMDRLCGAVAAFDQLGAACVVADFGTAITIDAVTDDGVYLGGTIAPGLSMSLTALAEKTDLLPQLTAEQPTWVFGKSTEQAIIGGVVFGARGALRERVEAYATELGTWPNVILTGGDAKFICPDVQADGIIQAIVPDLILRGVAIAYYRSLLPDS